MADEALEASIDEAMGLSLAENAAPYDGLMGTLPGWIPANFHSEFHAVRSRLLETHSRAELLHYIAETRAIFDPGNETYSRPSYVTPIPIMKDVSTLAHFQEAVRLGPGEGLALLTDPEHAGQVGKGIGYGLHQAGIASNPRGKIGDDGETNSQIIGRLALAGENKELSAKTLFTPYISELRDRALAPEETPAVDDWKKIVITYSFKDGRKSITGGQFAKVVSAYRTKKKLL